MPRNLTPLGCCALLAAGALLLTGCSASSSTAAVSTAPGPSGSSSAPTSAAPTAPTASPSPTSASPTPSPTSASPTPTATALPPPPVIDVCADYFDRPLPTLTETVAPPTNPTRRGIIAHVQRNLKRLGFDAGPTDGWYGAQTRTAVEEFQSDNDLTVDGVMGRQTWDIWFIVACGID